MTGRKPVEPVPWRLTGGRLVWASGSMAAVLSAEGAVPLYVPDAPTSPTRAAAPSGEQAEAKETEGAESGCGDCRGYGYTGHTNPKIGTMCGRCNGSGLAAAPSEAKENNDGA